MVPRGPFQPLWFCILRQVAWEVTILVLHSSHTWGMWPFGKDNLCISLLDLIIKRCKGCSPPLSPLLLWIKGRRELDEGICPPRETNARKLFYTGQRDWFGEWEVLSSHRGAQGTGKILWGCSTQVLTQPENQQNQSLSWEAMRNTLMYSQLHCYPHTFQNWHKDGISHNLARCRVKG